MTRGSGAKGWGLFRHQIENLFVLLVSGDCLYSLVFAAQEAPREVGKEDVFGRGSKAVKS